ncbi:MAG: RNA polymerase subunit sigma-70 [Acidimicrobiaceae bacterium]|nr:RNA polymerase subunit sigma-70 [Acidimicrobiaceae bacterium]
MTDSVLARAQTGDGDAFEELTNPYRRELHMHCYRMLGSFQDAEDVLQETLLAAWQGLHRFDGRSLRAWLYRIATNRCLNWLRATSRRPKTSTNALDSPSLFAAAAPSDEPWWLEPYPDALLGDCEQGPEARFAAKESIALSFVAGLQRLPTQQRAALVLRDVLGFSAAEAAEMLDSTPASVNSALQRARSGFEASRDPDRVALPRSPHEAETVERFVEALQHGDLERLVALLTDDARLTMPPEPLEFLGARPVAEFLSRVWGENVKVVPTRANGALAFGYYRPDPNADVYRASGLIVLAVEGEQVSELTRFGDKSLFACFGLPRTIPHAGQDG